MPRLRLRKWLSSLRKRLRRSENNGEGHNGDGHNGEEHDGEDHDGEEQTNQQHRTTSQRLSLQQEEDPLAGAHFGPCQDDTQRKRPSWVKTPHTPYLEFPRLETTSSPQGTKPRVYAKNWKNWEASVFGILKTFWLDQYINGVCLPLGEHDLLIPIRGAEDLDGPDGTEFIQTVAPTKEDRTEGRTKWNLLEDDNIVNAIRSSLVPEVNSYLTRMAYPTTRQLYKRLCQEYARPLPRPSQLPIPKTSPRKDSSQNPPQQPRGRGSRSTEPEAGPSQPRSGRRESTPTPPEVRPSELPPDFSEQPPRPDQEGLSSVQERPVEEKQEEEEEEGPEEDPEGLYARPSTEASRDDFRRVDWTDSNPRDDIAE